MTTIYDADLNDIPVIRDITFRVWPETYRSILSQGQIDYMLDMMYSETALKRQMSDGHVFLIANDEMGAAGFSSYQNKNEPALVKIHKLYILPSRQGKGWGRILIDEMAKRARSKGAIALELNVNRHNPALDFYRRLGFAVVREEDIDIGNGYLMNDYVMRLEL